MKVAIVGYGVVGQATKNTLIDNLDFVIHDPDKNLNGTWKDADIIFICTPTDNVKEYLNAVPQEKHHDIIIRSTIDYNILGDEFMSAGVWPEFLTERTWLEDSRNPICNVFGGSAKQLKLLQDITIFKNMVRVTRTDADMNIVHQSKGRHPFYHTKPKIAALMKVATNSFYTMKVTFANVLKEIAGNDYHELQKTLVQDPRMAADIHFQVPGPDGQYGYGGKCFPENLEIFKEFSNDANFVATMIDMLNKKYRSK